MIEDSKRSTDDASIIPSMFEYEARRRPPYKKRRSDLIRSKSYMQDVKRYLDDFEFMLTKKGVQAYQARLKPSELSAYPVQEQYPFRTNLENNKVYQMIKATDLASTRMPRSYQQPFYYQKQHEFMNLDDYLEFTHNFLRFRHEENERIEKKQNLANQTNAIKMTRIRQFIQKEVFESMNKDKRENKDAKVKQMENISEKVDQFTAGVDYSIKTLKENQIIKALQALSAIPKPPMRYSLNHTMKKKAERLKQFNSIVRSAFNPSDKKSISLNKGNSIRENMKRSTKEDSLKNGKTLDQVLIHEPGDNLQRSLSAVAVKEIQNKGQAKLKPKSILNRNKLLVTAPCSERERVTKGCYSLSIREITEEQNSPESISADPLRGPSIKNIIGETSKFSHSGAFDSKNRPKTSHDQKFSLIPNRRNSSGKKTEHHYKRILMKDTGFARKKKSIRQFAALRDHIDKVTRYKVFRTGGVTSTGAGPSNNPKT